MDKTIRLIILIINISLIFVGVTHGDELYDSMQLNRLIKEINNSSDKPILAIIAIDSSSSINNTTAEYVAGRIIDAVAALNNSENKIGYVSWNHKSEYSEPINYYADLKKNISKVEFGGYTCLEIGINKSISLIGKLQTNKRNMIILIMDGEENCNLTNIANFTCDRAKQIIPPDIRAWAIRIGNSNSKNNTLPCFNIKESSKNAKDDAIEGITKEIPVKESFEDSFGINLIGNTTKYQEQRTMVNITKIVEQSRYGGPRIKIRIETPNGPNVNNSLVLALDSSGSLDKGGSPSYGKNLREAIDPALKKIKTDLPNSSISILSWDDGIDFAFFPIGHTDPKTANLELIDNAIEGIENNKVFVDYPISIGGYKLPIWQSYPPTYYQCTEYESTDFTTGLKGAMDVLNNSYKNKKHENDTDLKSILFVAARSEFIPFSRDPTLIKVAKNRNYHIYTLGIGVINKSIMEDELKYAAEQTEGRYHYSSGSGRWSQAAILDEINNIVEEIRDMTLISNIKLVDTVYPYLEILPSTIQISAIKGKMVTSVKANPRINYNKDNTTTVEIDINENLSRSTILEITMDTKLNLSLPVDVAKEKRSICWDINQNTNHSTITYKWHTNQSYRMNLPENNIILR